MLKKISAVMLAMSTMMSGLSLTAKAVYTEADNAYEWNLTDITNEIGYDTAAFQSGTMYGYNGLTITGNSSDAEITSDGVKFTKVSSDNGQMNIAYMPLYNGTLSITATIGKSGSYYSKIYADDVLGERSNLVVDGSATGEATGETELEAGKIYYIYNGSSARAYIKSMTFTADLTSIVPSITLNNTFSDNMLIQRDKPIVLKGECKYLDSATITLQNDNDETDVQTKKINLNALFSWETELEAVSNYTDTYTLTITPDAEGLEPITISNIIFGDLYLCAGQSNMVADVSAYKNYGIDYTSSEYKVDRPYIRLLNYTQSHPLSAGGCDEIQDGIEWSELKSSESMSYKVIPAVVYSFATKLYEETEVPVGVIASAKSGTYITQWLPNTGIDSNNKNKNLYNTKIYPFRDMYLSGILWYQGESDRKSGDGNVSEYYSEKLESLAGTYRELFRNDNDVPFYYVAIPRAGGTISDPNNPEIVAESNLYVADIRQAQTNVYLKLKDTENNFGIIPTLDMYGNYTNEASQSDDWGNGSARSTFHLGQKPLLAQRVVNYVLRDVYGKTEHKDGSTIYTTGPVYKTSTAKGNELTVEFECTGNLKLMDVSQYSDSESEVKREEYGIDETVPQEFEIAGEDGVYYRATAELDGSKVILTSENVAAPVSFRYAFSGYNGDTYVECPNLTDDTNLPALVTVAEAESIESLTGIVKAKAYDYTTNEQLNNPEAKGYIAEISVTNTVNSCTWYLSNDNGASYKELITGSLPEISGGTVMIGLVIYDFSESVNKAINNNTFAVGVSVNSVITDNAGDNVQKIQNKMSEEGNNVTVRALDSFVFAN